jgi:hypothetical protein
MQWDPKIFGLLQIHCFCCVWVLVALFTELHISYNLTGTYQVLVAFATSIFFLIHVPEHSITKQNEFRATADVDGQYRHAYTGAEE